MGDALFVLSLNRAKISSPSNDEFELSFSKKGLSKVAWFQDRPARHTGHIKFSRFSGRQFWKKSFRGDLPNASLSYFDKNDNSVTFSFEMSRPKRDKLTGTYRITATPLKGNTYDIGDVTGKVERAFVFVDSSDAPAISLDPGLLGDAAAGLGIYQAYTWAKAAWQARALRQNTKKLKSEIDSLFGENDGLKSLYNEKIEKALSDMRSFGRDAEGFGDLKAFLSKDEFIGGILDVYGDVLEAIDFEEYGVENSEQLIAAIKDRITKASEMSYNKLKAIYKKDGAEGIMQSYENLLDVSTEELMQSPEFFSDFSKVAKAIRSDFDAIVKNPFMEMRRQAAAEGLDGGTALTEGLSETFAAPIASDVGEQLLAEDLVTGSEAGEAGAYILEGLATTLML